MTLAQFIRENWKPYFAKQVLPEIPLGLKRKQIENLTVRDLITIANILEVTPAELMKDIARDMW